MSEALLKAAETSIAQQRVLADRVNEAGKAASTAMTALCETTQGKRGDVDDAGIEMLRLTAVATHEAWVDAFIAFFEHNKKTESLLAQLRAVK